MPKFLIERNWIECVGHLWMPDTLAAKRIDLTSYDIDNIAGYAEFLSDGDRSITREAVAHWLSLNEGDFQGVDDFAAFITDAPDMPWADEDNELVYCDCMYGEGE